MKKGIKKETRHLVETIESANTICGRAVSKVLIWAKKGAPKPEDGSVCGRCKALKAGKKRTEKIQKKHAAIAAAGKITRMGKPIGKELEQEIEKVSRSMAAEALEGAAKIVKSAGKRVPAMAALADLPRAIYAKFKGTAYEAVVFQEEGVTTGAVRGTIGFGGNLYNSPSGAAMAITGKPVDGWTFWKYEKPDGAREAINLLRPAEKQFIPKAKEVA